MTSKLSTWFLIYDMRRKALSIWPMFIRFSEKCGAFNSVFATMGTCPCSQVWMGVHCQLLVYTRGMQTKCKSLLFFRTRHISKCMYRKNFHAWTTSFTKQMPEWKTDYNAQGLILVHIGTSSSQDIFVIILLVILWGASDGGISNPIACSPPLSDIFQ